MKPTNIYKRLKLSYIINLLTEVHYKGYVNFFLKENMDIRY